MILTAGMAWTQADADAVRAAITDLAVGKRTVSISFAGPPARTQTFALAELSQLEALLARIERSFGTTPRFRRASFSKGFDPPKDPNAA